MIEMDQYIVWIVVAVVTIAVVVIGGRLLASKIISAFTRLMQVPEERAVFHHKVVLLENTPLVQALAPASEFTREYGEDEKRRAPLFFLSPWPQALKVAWKKHKGSSRFVDVRAQLKAAAADLTVRVLDEERQPHNSGDEHFSVIVPLGDRTEEEVTKLKPMLKAKLGLYSVDAALTDDYLAVEFVCHTVKPVDVLLNRKFGVSVLDENPPESWKKLPLAVDRNEAALAVALHQTYVYGMSGSGKGSVVHAYTRQLAHEVRKGTVKLYGIDTKNEDVGVYRNSLLLEAFADSEESAEDLIEFFYQKMKERARVVRSQDLSAGKTGMRVELGQDNAVCVLMIDEFIALLLAMQSRKRYAYYFGLLQQIMLEGRSLGFIIIAAGQTMDEELLKRLRSLFVVTISLKAKKAYWTAVLFDLDENDPVAIEAAQLANATEGNDYATAGIGWIRDEENEISKVRFPFTSERDVLLMLREWGLREPGEATEFSEWRATRGLASKATPARRVEPVAKPVAVAPKVTAVEEAPAPKAVARPVKPKPLPAPSAPRSQVDELIAVKEFDDAKLARARERVAAKLEQGDSVKGRALLDAIEAELRIRARLAQYAPVKPQPLDDALPPLNF